MYGMNSPQRLGTQFKHNINTPRKKLHTVINYLTLKHKKIFSPLI
jgi:hypothetical protein